MATTNATIDVSVTGLGSLEKLSNSVSGIQQKFANLKGAIIAGGFAALGQGALRMADDLQDLSNATGIATGRLLEFKKALTTSGGQADAMPNAINQFVRSVDEAAQGSLKAQDSFRQLGISLNDLRSLGEQELLVKTLEEIGKIEDPSRRAALMMDKFGKSFKTVNPAELAQKLRDSAGSADKYAQSIERAAELNDQLAIAAGTVKMAFLEAFSPAIGILVSFNKAMEEGKGTMDALITALKLLGAAIIIAFTVSGIGAFVRVIGTIGRGLSAIMPAATIAGNTLKSIFQAQGPVMVALRGVGALLGVIVGGLASIAGMTNAFESPSNDGSKSEKEASDAAKEQARAQREVTDALAKKVAEIRRISDAFAKTNADQLDNINLDNQLIGKSKEYQETIRAQEAIFKRAADEADKLRIAKENLTEEEQRGGLGAIYDEQIAKIQKLAAADAERVTRMVENNSKLQNLEQFRLFGIQNQIDKSKELQQVQDDIAKLGLSEIEKKYYDITAAARASAKAAIDAEAARRGSPLTGAEQKKYYDEALKGTEALKEKQGELYAESRKFSTGWSNALNEFVDNATNAATQAQQIFSKVTSSMEDAFVNFAKTGKFEFKSMINSIIEDLLRMQIKATMAKVMGLGGGTGATGGLFGGKIIPGILASGGPVSSNRPYIVGERGPELFMPGVNGQMFPNSALGGSGQSVVYNIQAVDAPSFQALVARDPSFIHAVAMAGAKAYPR